MILTDNLFGDILTDEAGSVVGGVGYSASGCINASDEFPSMFEPIHGFRSGHRRSEQGQPDRRHPLRRHAARASRL